LNGTTRASRSLSCLRTGSKGRRSARWWLQELAPAAAV
jgi:hypothetical protein